MTVMFLVRHGLTDQTGKRLYGRTRGVHLDARGREQAESIAERLKGAKLAAIYSSPLERCRETALPLSRRTGLPVTTMRELLEADCGDWTGRPLRQLARSKAWRTVQQNPSRFRFPAGESFVEIQSRVLEAVETINRAHPRGSVAVFSHGDPIRLLVSSLAGAHLDGFQRIAVDAGSVSTIVIGDGSPRIQQLNVVPAPAAGSAKMRG